MTFKSRCKMAEAERQGLGQSFKSQSKYGTTSKLTCIHESFIKHYAKRGETLQGIALKYGTTVENIKRSNNMWTNDSLFLREYILIPLSKSPHQETNPFMNGVNTAGPHCSDTDEEIVTRKDIQDSLKMLRSNSNRSVASDAASISSSHSFSSSSTSEPSGKDFLSKFDSSLAQIKSNVQKLEHTSNFPEDSSNPLNLIPRRGSARSGLNGHSSSRLKSWSFDGNDPTVEPNLVFKSSSSSSSAGKAKRQVRTSLEKLEQTQDELFQL